MAGLKLANIYVFVILMLPLAAAGTHPYLSVRIGNEITLACQNREDFNKSCNSTTWLFGASRSFITVPLFEHGKIHNDARSKSGRLSVTENCSLVIKNITSLDDGRYNCRQFISGKQVSNFMVFLSVFNTAGIPPSNFTNNVSHEEKDSASTRTTASSTTTAKPKSEGSISSATTTQAPTTAVVTTSPSTTVINSKTTITTTKTKSPMRTTFTKSVTTTTTVVESLMTKNTTTSIVIRTKAISLGTIRITTSNTTVTTIKSPTKTTTFNSTTTITSTKSHTTRNTTESTTATTTIKSSRAAQECPNAVQSNIILIVVAGGFAVLFIMIAIVIWKISKLKKSPTSGNIEMSTDNCHVPGTSQERAHSKRQEGDVVTNRRVRVSYASSAASSDSSSIYATMKRI
ncbi:putative GPI-anchored protein pfl2 [Haplochromis burtoni]|uniref:putative GPI-anchored protein pfl2 n=1 Tax=Haplochromis burtoni TaxID=8153 RepID=UPI001C2D7E6B|nr:putative GPI-anchored protein pfl2 [Haplochromis burtoni]